MCLGDGDVVASPVLYHASIYSDQVRWKGEFLGFRGKRTFSKLVMKLDAVRWGGIWTF